MQADFSAVQQVSGYSAARKVYTQTTAAALRAKENIMETVTAVRENAGDILADAKEINKQRIEEEAEEIIEDAAEEAVPEA